MHTASLASPCPVAAEIGTPVPYLRSAPLPGEAARRGFRLSFTLPGDVRSPFVGRTVVAAALEAHGLGRYAWPATHVVHELVAIGARIGQGREIYVSLRQREDAVRILVWDQHARHDRPHVAALCEARRRRALWLLAAVVDDWGGEWDIEDAELPHHGTKSWVMLPR
ncbi:ATP-binding protein [Streptomyces sp. NPDC058195]|uniref:ATP-binding protein n=1 Tax=Streptomyces sp. NPDC058195 TaxID=3346375 RepID=UPI0036E42F0A